MGLAALAPPAELPTTKACLRYLPLNSLGAAGLALVALVALLPAAAHAQGAIEAWVQRYNGSGNAGDYARAIAVDAGGNVVVTGSSTGSGTWADYTTIKYSSAGVPLWTNRYSGPIGMDEANALAVDAEDNVVVTGRDATVKYSSAGVPLWTNRYAEFIGYGVAVDTNGDVYVTGTLHVSASDYDYLTIKYSSAGVLLWTNCYNGGGATALAVDAEGNVVVTGNDATIKYSSVGVPLWTNWSGGFAEAAAVDASGNVYVTGHVSAGSGGGDIFDYLTIAYSSAGRPLWTNRYSGTTDDEARAIAVDPSGNVVVSGASRGSATIKYSSAGVPLWTNVNDAGGRAMALDSSGNVYVTGSPLVDYATIAYSSAGVPLWTNRYNGPGNGVDDARAVAVDASGNVYVTGRSPGSGSDADYATVKYVTPPIITCHPVSRTNAVGTTASFTLEVAGSAPFGYQWRRQGTTLWDGANASGVTTTNLLIANVQLADAAGYSVVITNAYGSVTSRVGQLTVMIPPNAGRLSNLTYSPATGFSFIFRDGTFGRPYRIQTSPSLAGDTWVDWMSFTYTGPMALTDLGAVATTNRFYRALSP